MFYILMKLFDLLQILWCLRDYILTQFYNFPIFIKIRAQEDVRSCSENGTFWKTFLIFSSLEYSCWLNDHQYNPFDDLYVLMSVTMSLRSYVARYHYCL